MLWTPSGRKCLRDNVMFHFGFTLLIGCIKRVARVLLCNDCVKYKHELLSTLKMNTSLPLLLNEVDAVKVAEHSFQEPMPNSP